MSDRTDLSPVLDAMDATWDSIIDLAESLTVHEWSLPTRCPGWDVHDQIAHVASLEQILAGAPLPPEAPPAAHIRNPVGERMERGVHALRGLPPAELVAVLRAAIAARRAALQANPPKSGDELVGVMGNPVPAERSLPIRVFDVWVHEQDVRAATGRPGNADGPGARVGRDLILGLLPMYWVKEAGARPGQTLLLRVSGALPVEQLVVVGHDGRAALADPGGASHYLASDLASDPASDRSSDPASGPASDPVAVIELDWLDLVARANGRDGATETPVSLSGDRAMGQAVVDALPMSP